MKQKDLVVWGHFRFLGLIMQHVLRIGSRMLVWSSIEDRTPKWPRTLGSLRRDDKQTEGSGKLLLQSLVRVLLPAQSTKLLRLLTTRLRRPCMRFTFLDSNLRLSIHVSGYGTDHGRRPQEDFRCTTTSSESSCPEHGELQGESAGLC